MPTGIYKRKITSPEVLFLKKVEKTNICWNWKGYKNKKGYGKFVSFEESLAHRVSYILYKGKIPKGFMICHSCDNPSCVNPEHLWVGKNSDNQIDCVKKGRARRNPVKGEKCGRSKLTEEKVIAIKKSAYKYTQKELGEMFECHQSNIHYILSGKTWNYA